MKRLSNQAIKDAVIAYQNFFKGLTGHPKFKSRKRSKASFYADPVKIKFTATHVKLESIARSKKKAAKVQTGLGWQNMTAYL